MTAALPLLAAAPLPEPQVPAAEVRRIVEDVLSRAEFAEARPTLLQRLRAWVGEQIGQLLEQLVAGARGPIIGTVIILIVAAIAVWLAIRLVRGTKRDAPVDLGLSDVGRPATDWRAEAERHAGGGRWREAVRAEYRALVADLAAAGVLDEVPGRTAGELLRAVAAARPEARAAFAQVTGAFEAAWYAHAAVDRDDLEAVRARSEACLAAATATPVQAS